MFSLLFQGTSARKRHSYALTPDLRLRVVITDSMIDIVGDLYVTEHRDVEN